MKWKTVGIWTGIIGGLALFLFFAFQTTSIRGIDVGDPIDDLVLTDLQGRPVDLSEWRGQNVMLRISASSCTSCPFDFPLLDQWQQRLGDDVRVVAVQVGDQASNVRSMLMGETPNVPIVLDESGASAQRLGLRQVPAVYFVTARGTLSSASHVEVARTDVDAHVRLARAGGPTMERDVRTVSRQLQCQECQGRSVWESDSPSSLNLREEIRSMLTAGMRPGEVVEALVADYGEWMRMTPGARGLSALAWILPIGVTLVGLGTWIFWMGRTRSRRTSASRKSFERDDEERLRRTKDRLARRIDDYM